MTDYFADSYAYLAAMGGSRRYMDLLATHETVTTALNVLEVATAVLRLGGDVAAATRPLFARCVSPHPSVAVEAARFRQDRLQAGADCSTVDAWGYATARSLRLPFLTGDEGFKGVPGVKFVKA